MKHSVLTLCASAALFAVDAASPPGSVDPGFVPDSRLSYASIESVVVQPDGRVLVGGEFYYYVNDLSGNSVQYPKCGPTLPRREP